MLHTYGVSKNLNVSSRTHCEHVVDDENKAWKYYNYIKLYNVSVIKVKVLIENLEATYYTNKSCTLSWKI